MTNENDTIARAANLDDVAAAIEILIDDPLVAEAARHLREMARWLREAGTEVEAAAIAVAGGEKPSMTENALTAVASDALREPHELPSDALVNPPPAMAIVRHRWAANDVCTRCAARRDGYGGGRTGSIRYTDVHGVTRDRSGECTTVAGEKAKESQ